MRELKGFRHVMRHAYDLTLKQDRLAELARLDNTWQSSCRIGVANLPKKFASNKVGHSGIRDQKPASLNS